MSPYTETPSDEIARLKRELHYALSLLRDLERTLAILMHEDDSEERREARALIAEWDWAFNAEPANG